MSALFLGEIIYLFLQNGKLGLVICNAIVLFLMTTLTGVVFIIHKKPGRKKSGDRRQKQAKMGILLCLIMLSGINLGYRIGFSYSHTITKMERQYEDNAQLYIEGRIAKVEEKTNSIYCYVEQVFVDKSKWKGKQLILVIKGQNTGETGDIGQLIPGNYIHAAASYVEWNPARNDGGFDEREYYYSIGVGGKCEVSDYYVENGSLPYDRLLKALYNIKKAICFRVNQFTDSHYAGIYEGILMGEKSAVPEDTKDLYRLAGISHLLSISGLHISLIGYFIYRWLRKFRGITVSALVSAGIICLYAMMTGFGFSTKRAVIMFMVNLLADISGRSYDLISALSFAFILIMVTNPFCVFHSGFLLSFTAILGINPLYVTVEEFLGTQNKWMKSWIAGICINLMTRPVIMHVYHELPMYSSFVNLLILSFISVMAVCGFLGIFISYVWFDMGRVIFLAGCKILKLYEFICRQFVRLPGAVMIVKSPERVIIALYYLMIILIILILACFSRYKFRNNYPDKDGETGEGQKQSRFWKKKLIKYVIAGLVNGFLFVMLTHTDHARLEVKMIDVGQGDSIYINIKGSSVLIDAGSSSEYNITEYTILPFLKANGVKQLDYLVMTHSDTDHVCGMAELMNERYNGRNYVKNLILPDIGENMKDELYREVERTAVQNNVNILYFSSGSRIEYKDVKLECIWPEKGADEPDKNNLSLVFQLESDNFNMLFTGDLSEEGERQILKRQKASRIHLANVDILKVGHHGSNGSGCKEFMDLLMPRVALISCGINNTYGHPGEQAVERLKAVNSDLFITMETGQINIIEKDKGFYVETFLH